MLEEHVRDNKNAGVSRMVARWHALRNWVWSLLWAYPKARKKASRQEKYSAYSQLPLSFLRDATRTCEKRAFKPEYRHAKMRRQSFLSGCFTSRWD